MSNTNTTGVGNAIDRVDGHLKVTGMAKYATEFPVKNKVYAQGINSTIAKGENYFHRYRRSRKATRRSQSHHLQKRRKTTGAR